MSSNIPNGQPAKSPASAAAPASPADVADPLRGLRTQTPQEALGLPSGSGLFVPFLQATVVTAIAFAALTVGPYLWDRSHPAPAKAQPAAPGEQPSTPAPADAPTAPPPSTPGTTPTPKQPASVAPTSPKLPAGKDDILNKLGENGTKTASPKVNPLDKKDDDLLKEIK